MSTVVVLPDGSRCYSGPNCLRHGVKNRLPAGFADKPRAEQLADMEQLKNPLASKTPSEVDEVIADLYDSYYEELNPVRDMLRTRKRLVDNIARGVRWAKQENVDKLDAEIRVQQGKANMVLAEIAPYEVEFSRRPWTRGFLVSNVNGHVHKNMSCSTCTPTTRYTWLTNYSGKAESELVGDAGEKACTVCYPSAPVDVLARPPRLKNSVLDAAQAVKDKVKAEREAKKVAADAKKIVARDGSPVLDDFGHPLKTTTTAENFVADVHTTVQAIEAGKYSVGNQEWLETRKTAYRNVLDALAFKKGVTVDELLIELKPKFDRKYKKDWA